MFESLSNNESSIKLIVDHICRLNDIYTPSVTYNLHLIEYIITESRMFADLYRMQESIKGVTIEEAKRIEKRNQLTVAETIKMAKGFARLWEEN